MRTIHLPSAQRLYIRICLKWISKHSVPSSTDEHSSLSIAIALLSCKLHSWLLRFFIVAGLDSYKWKNKNPKRAWINAFRYKYNGWRGPEDLWAQTFNAFCHSSMSLLQFSSSWNLRYFIFVYHSFNVLYNSINIINGLQILMLTSYSSTTLMHLVP